MIIATTMNPPRKTSSDDNSGNEAPRSTTPRINRKREQGCRALDDVVGAVDVHGHLDTRLHAGSQTFGRVNMGKRAAAIQHHRDRGARGRPLAQLEKKLVNGTGNRRDNAGSFQVEPGAPQPVPSRAGRAMIRPVAAQGTGESDPA